MLDKEKIIAKIKTPIYHDNKIKQAAVLVPFIDTPDGLSLLFEVRSAQLHRQPGDICFPGGVINPEDKTTADAAVRETTEELGISPESINLIADLPPFIESIGYQIFATLGEISPTAHFALNTAEVEQIFTVPVSWLLDNPPLLSSMQVAHKPSPDFPFHLIPQRSQEWVLRAAQPLYFYHYRDFVIWGLTARLVKTVLNIIR